MRPNLATTLGLALLLGAPLADAFEMRVQPVNSSIGLGGTTTISIAASGLAPAGSPSLSSYDFNLTFDAAILGIDTSDADGDGVMDSVTLDPAGQLDLFDLGINTRAVEMIGIGQLNLFELSFDLPTDLDSMQLGAFVLAEVELQGIRVGSSALTLTPIQMVDASGSPLSTTVANGTIQVTGGVPVPVPSTAGLLAAGVLAGFIGRRRRSPSRSR